MKAKIKQAAISFNYVPKTKCRSGPGLAWIQTVRHSGICLESTFEKVDFERNRQTTKSMQNCPVVSIMHHFSFFKKNLTFAGDMEGTFG